MEQADFGGYLLSMSLSTHGQDLFYRNLDDLFFDQSVNESVLTIKKGLWPANHLLCTPKKVIAISNDDARTDTTTSSPLPIQ